MEVSPELVLKILSLMIVLVAALTAIYVKIMVNIARLDTRQGSHEKNCEEHKEILNGDLKTIRDDIKKLLSRKSK